MNTEPLTDTHLTALNSALRNIADYRAVAAKAKAAGMDTSMHDQAADQMEQALTQFKTEFFGLKGGGKKKGE
jgi:hypothetical protein